MIVFLWIILAIFPAVIGVGVMTIVYRKQEQARIGFAGSYLLGLVFCLGMAECAHVVGMFGKLTLKQTGLLLGLVLAVVFMVLFVVGIYGFFKDKSRYAAPIAGENVNKILPFAFLGIFLVQILFLYCREPLVTAGDITLETVQSFWAEDGIYQVMPLTGTVSEFGMPLRYTVLCLPTLYAILSQSFGVEPELLVCNIIPIAVLAASYLAYYQLSACLFGQEKYRKRYLFLVLVALIFCFTDGAVFLDGYQVLHSAYTGTAIRNLVLVPFTMCAALEKRWWKAIGCILAEACIAWTFWGCGVCLIITLGILILEILEKRFPEIGRYLQIFRKKEEQS